MKYIKGFDSLRAISIVLVILTHLGLSDYFFGDEFLKNRVWLLVSGETGVQIFFTLSGFLITSILLTERNSFNKLSFKNFYARRFLRFLPPLVVFYITIAVLMKLDLLQPMKVGFFYSLFYVYNFVPDRFYTPELGHTWSTALEEQFYLTWPILINYIRNYRVLIIVIYSIILLCIFSIYLYPHIEFTTQYKPNRWFIPAIAPVLIGSYLAILNEMYKVKWASIFKGKHIILVISFILFLFPIYSPFVVLQLSFIVQSIGISILLLWLFYNQTSVITKVLDNKILSGIGKISYGLYVYQGLFLTTGPGGELWIQQFPQNILLTLVTAIISYHILEKPILSWKTKFRRTI